MNSSHVTHLLARYVEGQLSPRTAARVQQHTLRCAACRDELARRDRLAADLHRSLPVARRSRVDSWWAGIAVARTAPHRRLTAAVLAPALIGAALLLMPLVSGLQQVSRMSGWPVQTITTTAQPAEHPAAATLLSLRAAHDSPGSLRVAATPPAFTAQAIGAPPPPAPVRAPAR